jgi:hypothetical protein
VQLAPRPSTVGIPECGGLSFATRLRAYLTTGIALIGVSAIAAMPVVSDAPEIQARPVQPAGSDTVTEMLTGLGEEVGEVTGGVVSTSGSLGAVVGRRDLSHYLSPYAEPATTFDNLKSFGRGVLADPLSIATQVIANQVGYRRIRKARRSLSDVADGMVDVSPAPPIAFGDLFSGGVTAAFGDLQPALLNLLVTLNLKLIMLQTALLNLLVIPNRNVIPESLGGTST